MKNILFTSLAVLGLGITGCSNEDLGVAKSGVDEVCATMGDVDSRTAMNGNSVVWSTGDEIGMFVTSGGSSTCTNTKYTLSSGAGTKSAEFSGVLDGENPVKKAAFYPYGNDASYDESKISLTLKDAYNYKEGENSSAPMACQINEGAQNVLAFKNAGALMSVTVNNIPKDYTWAKLTSTTAAEKTTAPAIAGSAQIAFAEGIPTLTSTGTSNSSSITINFTASNDVTSKTFYFPLPVADYPALELSIGNSSTNTVLKTKALNAKRNERYTTTITLDEVSGSVPTTVESASAVADALANTNSVSVADVASTESSPTVSIPKKSTQTENVSISFENISTTNTVAIKEESTSASGNSAPENVLVSVPQLDTAPKFEIVLPASTVTLAANGETATYDEVTATTAENTLVIGKGVTVNTLKVKAGNVRVNSGAKIGTISRESDNTSTVIIYKEDGATLPNLSGNNAFEVVDAAVADLKAAFIKGGTYQLTSDLDIVGSTLTLPADKTLTLDLNGCDITAANTEAGRLLILGKMTLKDSKGTGRIISFVDYTGTASGYGLISVSGESASLTLESGNVYAVRENASSKGQYGVSVENGADFTMTGGKIEAGWYAVTGNGTYKTQNSIVNINGGELISTADYAMYLPQAGTTTISGGTIKGACGAIGQRSGNLIINSGATLISDGTGSTGDWKDGSSNAGNSVISVACGTGDNHNTYGNCNVTINGGVFTANGNANVIDKQPDPKHAITISVNGGTFSDPSALAYLGDNADVTVKLNADTELVKSMIVEKGTATIDLNNHTLTASSSATVKINNKDEAVVAVAVKDGAKTTVKNGKIGDSSNKLSYGVFAFGKAYVTLDNVSFSEMVIYAYNGAGELAATNCTFKGWLSGWHHGGTFTGCTFTIGKAYYPAAICYGSTTFAKCKFLKNGVDADVYDNGGAPDEDGYYRCSYVVAQCNPSNSIGFTNCKFIDENNAETGSIAKDNHPFHACGWGNGTTADYNVTVDGAVVTSQCSDKNKTSNGNK